ncbi:hypothetical protein B0H13DRAFT_1923439 [Mycena leptocephala]|nr:hypothetical protein B0H13DRAFT_1923439 [Mycena leptocephala]
MPATLAVLIRPSRMTRGQPVDPWIGFGFCGSGSSIAYATASPIRELHQVRNYTACTFDHLPHFWPNPERFESKISYLEFTCAALVDDGNQARRVETGQVHI